MTLEHLRASLADRYRIGRELGSGGMAGELVTEVTARLTQPPSKRIPCNIKVYV